MSKKAICVYEDCPKPAYRVEIRLEGKRPVVFETCDDHYEILRKAAVKLAREARAGVKKTE